MIVAHPLLVYIIIVNLDEKGMHGILWNKSDISNNKKVFNVRGMIYT